MELVDKKDVEKVDKRNSKRMFLKTDAICLACGTILNAYYENECFICKCGESGDDNFITGKLGVNVRLLLMFHIEELKALCEISGTRIGGRSQMVVGLLRNFEKSEGRNFDERIDIYFVNRIIRRNKRCFWFIEDIANAMPIKHY